MKRLLMLLLLVGCPKQGSQVNVWETPPRLPSPTAATYSRSKEAPSDAGLRALLGTKSPWDGALSGAAAGLALNIVNETTTPSLTKWKVREALWRAGYPYPASDVRAWKGMANGAPPAPLLEWLKELGEGDDLGLVRARGHDEDIWVALRAHPIVDIGPVPRQLPVGGTLTLPPIPDARYIIADANGNLLEGSLDEGLSQPVGSPGEWLLKIEAAELIASMPVYVGIVPPSVGLIDEALPLRTAKDALDRTENLLALIRDVYGVPALERDYMLDAGARSLLTGQTSSGRGVVRSLGLQIDSTALWQCQGTTVEACVDSVVWNPHNRLALLGDRSALGLAAEVDASGVHIVGIVSRTE